MGDPFRTGFRLIKVLIKIKQLGWKGATKKQTGMKLFEENKLDVDRIQTCPI